MNARFFCGGLRNTDFGGFQTDAAAHCCKEECSRVVIFAQGLRGEGFTDRALWDLVERLPHRDAAV